MFSRKFRLPAKTPMGSSRLYVSVSFLLKCKKNNLPNNRYGFVVSKKVDARATTRNEIKRRFRAILESYHANLSQGFDVLFIVKIAAKEKSFIEVQKEIEEAVRKCIISNI